VPAIVREPLFTKRRIPKSSPRIDALNAFEASIKVHMDHFFTIFGNNIYPREIIRKYAELVRLYESQYVPKNLILAKFEHSVIARFEDPKKRIELRNLFKNLKASIDR